MKVERRIYKGIEYVLLTDLPQAQREHILQSLSQDRMIKILIEGAVVSNCLQYKDYSFWFDNVYRTRQQPVTEITENLTQAISITNPGLALNKA